MLWFMRENTDNKDKKGGCRGYEYKQVASAAEALGGENIHKIVGLYADYKYAWTCGMPDLLLYRNSCEVMFVEVKSEKDVLSKGQRAWMNELRGFGIKTITAKVREKRNVDKER